jgi:hypothetical protein
MAEGDYVEPLTGREIINDLLWQIDEKLTKDCNLRDSDAYAGGYSAKVTISIQAYGMDTAAVEAEVSTGKPKAVDPEKDRGIEATLEVPAEAALDQVRERSDQPVPTLTVDSGGKPLIRPRRYGRRDSAAPGGGATGEILR